jgi:hypothetical protein
LGDIVYSLHAARFGYSDPAMEEALHDIPLLHPFAGLDAIEQVMPDKSNILRCRHLLEQRELTTAIFAEVNAALTEKGLSMKHGSVVDTILINLPGSSKNQNKKRDPEMSQNKKSNQRCFGMKSRRRRTPIGWSREAGYGQEQSEVAPVTHIGLDAASGLIHTPVICEMNGITRMGHGQRAAFAHFYQFLISSPKTVACSDNP